MVRCQKSDVGGLMFTLYFILNVAQQSDESQILPRQNYKKNKK